MSGHSKWHNIQKTKGILLADLASGLLLIVCIVFILSSSYNPFIYFRF